MNEAFSIAVFLSGKGSNLRALLKHIHSGSLKATVAVVVSDKADAPGLQLAKETGIPTIIQQSQQHQSRQEYDEHLIEKLRPYPFDLIVLAGFMRILNPKFVAHYAGQIINIHPSLLPNYPGLNTYQKALDNDDMQHGCTVHWVTAMLDAGPIIMQQSFSIDNQDNVQTLKQKTQQIEHQIYWQAIEDIRLGKYHPPQDCNS